MRERGPGLGAALVVAPFTAPLAESGRLAPARVSAARRSPLEPGLAASRALTLPRR